MQAAVELVGLSSSEASDSWTVERGVDVCYVALSGRSVVVSLPTHGFTLATHEYQWSWSVQKLEVDAFVRGCLKEAL